MFTNPMGFFLFNDIDLKSATNTSILWIYVLV